MRDKDRGNDTGRLPRYIAMDHCQTELIASSVWSLLIHFTAGGRGSLGIHLMCFPISKEIIYSGRQWR
ncbi:hypothetical protein Y032_0116g578 [Ancylostoma ceylanicum]|uniref:Uncharacterized protein n=1 Tax=Ancylostoma ceylanicum TaxID=53326 RepID=A0A016TCF5_9BILA|nr:hypothetical protein Y032_0116g578 [Ancylostoma ceylanicum]